MDIIENFFERYANTALHGIPSELAEFYGRNFVVVGPKESMAYANDEKFLTWLENVQNFNNQTRLEKMFLRKVRSNMVGKHTIQATVTWGVIYRKTGNKIIEFDIHYILEKFHDEMKIILYVSDDDQEQLMKELGIIE